ncbi:MAG: hypothetical protein COV44_06380 [Deltaproteobacteria bacterium CG11_big_fil_rev_8_21_14_0_20_45_16]|nr:MAG: hypothetical protein COV44_06380 [Deltaproteobacteria bacterium CG11_big_fil_rev_8_21_14_0_20_45_16]
MSTKSRSARSASRDWRAKSFLWTSLIVTALSIIFFFAGRYLSHKIKELDSRSPQQFLYELAQYGGVVISNIRLESKIDDEPFDSAQVQQLSRRLESLKGQIIFNVDIQSLTKEVENLPWVQAVRVYRRFPDKLEVLVAARQPALLVRAQNSWLIVDEAGAFVGTMRAIKKEYFGLPKVFGYETQISGEIEEINRLYEDERSKLADLVKVVRALKEKVNISVEEVRIQRRDWLDEVLFQVGWRDSQSRKFQVSLLSHYWEDRLTSLQFVMSDIVSDRFQEVSILGQYKKRWVLSFDSRSSEISKEF